MKRKIIKIHDDKCNGCGLCITACHEGAIELVNGKAQLVSDKYCDGLGNCLPACPAGAIEIIEREAEAFDEEAVNERIKTKNTASEDRPAPFYGGCPGTMARNIERNPINTGAKPTAQVTESISSSELRQWPVQLFLINSRADYLKGANLLIAADCTAYAYANFHRDFIKNHVTVIGCPKLDDLAYYHDKLVDILKNNEKRSVTVARMEVPCCGGIVSAVKEAMLKAQKIVPFREVVITIDGEIRG